MTAVHKVLGAKRIEDIGDNNGLSPDEKKIIDEILEKWENLVGKTEDKILVVVEILKNNPSSNPSKVSKALMEINLEFAVKSTRFKS